ncbi:MAG TPA: DUF4185 domain-containing protein [Tepidisphaeraceae bacterium]|jgi:hypothetical protein|nr:DUF4185 domain-containing protein [Tepidisphaeraceae bacterium]
MNLAAKTLAVTILFSVATMGSPASAEAPPYPHSPIIGELSWDAQVVKLTDGAGDNWPITWVEGDLQITSLGDGPGFSKRKPRLSLGFARVTGNPPTVLAEDFVSNIDSTGGGSKGIKSSALLMVDQTLYLFVRNYKPDGKDFKHSRLASSNDRGATWTWADWYFSGTFGCPEFVQFGPSYQGARDGYVYIASQDNDSAYEFSPNIVLARVPRESVGQRGAWEFFAGMDAAAQPTWSADIANRKPIFTDPHGTERIAITYNAGVRRYILTTPHQPPGITAMHTPALGVFDAPEPWGPWTTVSYEDDWAKGSRTYHQKFPSRWMSRDGRTMWLVFSGLDGGYYTFCLRKATLKLTAR